MGTEYRIGGDEFCVVSHAARIPGPDELHRIRRLLDAPSDGAPVRASFGSVRIPAEAPDLEAALALADRRMYDDKAVRKGRAAA